MYTHDALLADALDAGFITEDPPDYQDPDATEPPDYGYYPPPVKPAFRFFSGADLLTPRPVKWLVRGIVEASVTAGVFGAPASGKSFAGVDLSLCIANGCDWHGHRVDAGAVAYFAGEGQAGLRRRVSSWVQSNPGTTADNFKLAAHVCHLPTDAADVINSLEGIPSLKMVVLDTLQRTMDGDENSSKDMSAYIQSIDAIKAAFPDLSIVIIHHTGHGSADRARGSSVLKASLDAEILVSKDAGGVVTLQCTKAKDAEPFTPMSFKLNSVMLDGWADDTGQPVTSAVLEYLEGHQQVQDWRAKVRGSNHKKAMTVLETLHQAQRRNLELSGIDPNGAQVKVSDWRSDCLKQKITRKASQFDEEVMDKLIEKEIIRTTASGLYVEIVG